MKFLKIALIAVGALSLSLAAQESSIEPEKPAVVEQLSQAELDADMARIEQALGETDEVKEFVPKKPLSADLPVALPSDI